MFTAETDARMDAVIAELEPEEALTRDEAARRIGVSAFKLRRIEMGALEKFLKHPTLGKMWTEHQTL